MEIRHLKYMLAVAEEGHFNLAAKRLHIAQPALSQNIKQLEEEIGAQLFSRTTRKVTLTDAGRVFYQEATGALTQLDSVARSARRVSLGEAGSLTIGFTETAIFGPLRQTLHRFFRRYPDVQIITRECSVTTLFDKLQDGIVDIACSEDCTPNANFEMKQFPEVDVMVALHKESPLAQEKSSIEIKALANESFILPTQNTTWGVYEKFARALAKAGLRPRHEYWADSAISGIALVAAGLGVCLVPQFAQILHTQVAYRRVISPRIRISPQLVWHKGRTSLVAANFIALA